MDQERAGLASLDPWKTLPRVLSATFNEGSSHLTLLLPIEIALVLWLPWVQPGLVKTRTQNY
jgi:hypothetical protein